MRNPQSLNIHLPFKKPNSLQPIHSSEYHRHLISKFAEGQFLVCRLPDSAHFLHFLGPDVFKSPATFDSYICPFSILETLVLKMAEPPYKPCGSLFLEPVNLSNIEMVISTSGRRTKTWLSKSYPEQPILRPTTRGDINSTSSALLESPEFRDVVANRLSGAVQVPTITFDEMGKVGSDPRWDIFYDFSKYIRETFPVLWVIQKPLSSPNGLIFYRYEKLEVTTINKHGLLYTWKGSDIKLKPLLFMAHSDVKYPVRKNHVFLD